VAVVDVSQDPNARSAITPQPRTPTAAPTPAASPTPVAVAPTDQDLVGSVVGASMQPLLAGGRIGLILGGLAAAGYLALQRLRQRH
jgi:predicted lipid-binding transport protein (Tim44 family)